MMDTITSVLSAYEQQEKRRALGGIYALAGFDYQLRLYLAQFVESLTKEGGELNEGGQVFLEALSDLAMHDADNHLVCIQVKRTLTSETLKDAANEVMAIERFWDAHYSNSRTQVKYELVASQGDSAIQWSSIPVMHPARSTISELLAQGRLLPPRIEPDPWWCAIVAVWRHLKDPYAFLRFALDRALSRGPTAADAQRIRDDICEYFSKHRLTRELPGQLLTSSDFQLSEHPSPHLEVGREITLARLRDQQYMPRPQRLDALYARLLEQKDLSLRSFKSEAQVFWLNGRSGVGKSVLLLQTVERLVTDGWRVLWLKGHAELLDPALRTIADVPVEWRPDFIAIDDIYDRDARERLDLGRLGEFIDECGHQTWPVILTCGPTEFADSFKEAATYRGFELYLDTVETIDTHETAEIEVWYCERTGKSVQRGTAFSQAAQEDNGLFVSLALELAHGDLNVFAQRFGKRIQLNDLDKALWLPLALNRLYLRAPYDWLTEQDREKLATLNSEGDFSLLDASEEGQIVRLTHPHLANALYLALRKPANSEAYTNDLVAVFQRAITECNTGLVSQLLRLFSGREQGLAIERLSILNFPSLAQKCARAWVNEHVQRAFDADGLVDVATSWACWATKIPSLNQALGLELWTMALRLLESAYKAWPTCWLHLARFQPKHGELFSWAAEHLANPLRIRHPRWSFVWECCVQNDAARQEIWHTMGLEWLQQHLWRPDWHIVWKRLLPANDEPDWKNDPVLILGRRRLYAESDGPDWAFVLQDLYALAAPHSPQARELADLARAWLNGREDRAEWAHVWQVLLKQCDALPETLPLSELLHLGAQWLVGREDRAEWAHVWRALLEQRNVLPETLSLSGLLRLGAQWLVGREDRAEWAHVWQVLLEQCDALPETLSLSELLRLGAQWLVGREDRAEWMYVWRALLEQRNVLPETLSLSELLRLGAQWLVGREDRAEWTHVWRALLEQRNVLPETLPLSELLHLGAQWLAEREDRTEWTYVWQALLEQCDVLPETLPLSKLLHLGAQWLVGREDRAEWAHIWQGLLKNHDVLPEELPLSKLLHLGAQWLVGREDRAEWAHIWQGLLKNHDVLPEELPLHELLHLGARWLAGHDETEEWGFICERLLEQQFQAADFFEDAASWLNRSRKKPEWPLLAAKFIVVAPQHAASVELAAILIQQIKKCPNNAHWFKTVSLVANLSADSNLPQEVHDWLRVLNSRKELPAWTEARRCLDEGLPLKGRVTVPKEKHSYVVELEIGLIAICSEHRNGLPVAKGNTYEFFVQALNIEKDFVLVGLDKPVVLEVGQSYEGCVIAKMTFGLRVAIEGRQGLLHHTQCPDWTNLVRTLPVGSQICVEILAMDDKGPKLRYAGPQLKFGIVAEELTVGCTYDAVVTGLKEYGIFLRIGARVGLLHRSQLSPNADIFNQYRIGQQHVVQVISIRSDGKVSFVLPGG